MYSAGLRSGLSKKMKLPWKRINLFKNEVIDGLNTKFKSLLALKVSSRNSPSTQLIKPKLLVASPTDAAP